MAYKTSSDHPTEVKVDQNKLENNEEPNALLLNNLDEDAKSLNDKNNHCQELRKETQKCRIFTVCSTKSVLQTKQDIWKNVIILSIGFFVMFTPFYSISNIQSTLNKEEGIGTASLAIIYAAVIISFLLLPSLVISKLGCKWAMCAAWTCYLLYMSANVYPTWAVIIFTSALLGLGAGPLWTAQSIYLTQVSSWFAQMTKTKEKDALTYFFGIFFMVAHLASISGNLLLSAIISQTRNNRTAPSQSQIEQCIQNSEAAISNITTLERPSKTQVYILCGTWTTLGLVGLMILMFLDNIQAENLENRTKTIARIAATAKHFWKSRIQKILMFLPMYNGLIRGFTQADYSKSFVGCTLGIENVGYVMMCNGFFLSLFCALSGRLAKYVGQLPFLTLAFMIYGGLLTTLMVWQPTTDSAPVLYTITALCGIADGILKTQSSALYGHIFQSNTQAAFACYFLFEAFGYIIAFGYSSHLDTQRKLYVLQVLLAITVVSYYLVYLHRRKKKSKKEIEDDAADESESEAENTV